jgi:hypothetical protein
MEHEDRVAFDFFASYFTAELLSPIVSTGSSEIFLSDADIQQLLEDNLFVHFKPPPDFDPTKVPKMRIFTVDEPLKNRRRLIIWTIDINAAGDLSDDFPIRFTSLTTMIHEATAGFNFTLDSKACYHQFKLPESSRRFYAFYAKSFGWLSLATLPTGQRHTVGYAQCIARSLISRAYKSLGSPIKTSFEAYIDNFRGTAPTASAAKAFLAAFYGICWSHRVTLNESLQEAAVSIGKPVVFRGVALLAGDTPVVGKPTPAVGLSDKTRSKLLAIRQQCATWETWTVRDLLSKFGVLVFASTVVAIPLHRFYYVYKLVRRRSASVSSGQRSYSDPARCWPSTQSCFEQWIDELLLAPPRYPWNATNPDEHQAILFTDASNLGYGAVLFLPDGQVFASGGKWAHEDTPIAELESWALFFGLRDLVPPGLPVRCVIDNTTVGYAWAKTRSRNFVINACIGRLAGFNIISVEYIDSRHNLADGLSRGITPENFLATTRHALRDRAGFGENVSEEDPPATTPVNISKDKI